MKAFVLLLAILAGCCAPNGWTHGEMHDQIQEVSKQIAADSGNAALYHKRGELHRAHGDHSLALKDYDTAEKLNPKLDVVFLSRGRSLFEATNYSEALLELDVFLQRVPQHRDALWLRGRTLVQLNKRAEAEKAFQAAMALPGETSPDQYIERAGNLRESGAMKEASAVLEEGINTLGPLITLQLAAVDLETATRQYIAALRRIEALLATAERKESYFVRKGELLEKMGEGEKAREAYLKALDAIASLPARLQKTKATMALANEVRQRLRTSDMKGQPVLPGKNP